MKIDGWRDEFIRRIYFFSPPNRPFCRNSVPLFSHVFVPFTWNKHFYSLSFCGLEWHTDIRGSGGGSHAVLTPACQRSNYQLKFERRKKSIVDQKPYLPQRKRKTFVNGKSRHCSGSSIINSFSPIQLALYDQQDCLAQLPLFRKNRKKAIWSYFFVCVPAWKTARKPQEKEDRFT